MESVPETPIPTASFRYTQQKQFISLWKALNLQLMVVLISVSLSHVPYLQFYFPETAYRTLIPKLFKNPASFPTHILPQGIYCFSRQCR